MASSSSSPPPPPGRHELPFRSASAGKERVQRSRQRRTGISGEPESPSNSPSPTPESSIVTDRSPPGTTEAAGAGPSIVSTVKQLRQKRVTISFFSTIRHEKFTYPPIRHAIRQSNNRRELLRLLQQELQAIHRDSNDDGDDTMRRQWIRQLKAAIRDTEIDIAELDREAVSEEQRKKAKSLRTPIGALSTASQGQTVMTGSSGWPVVTGQLEQQGNTARSSGSDRATPLESVITTGRIASSSTGRGIITPNKQFSRKRTAPAYRQNEDATWNAARTPTPARQEKMFDTQSQSPSLSGDKKSTKVNPETDVKVTGQSAGTREGAAGPSSNRSQPVTPRSSSAVAGRLSGPYRNPPEFYTPPLDGSSAAVPGATGPLIGKPGSSIPLGGSSDAVMRRASDPPRSLPGSSLPPPVGNFVPIASPILNVGDTSAYEANAANTASWNQAGAQASDRPGAAITRQDRYWGAAGQRQGAGTASGGAWSSTVEKGKKEGAASKSSGSKRRAAGPPDDRMSRDEQRDAGSVSGARGATGSSGSRMGPPASKQASRQRDSASTTATRRETGNTRIEQEEAEDELHWTDLIEYHQLPPDGG